LLNIANEVMLVPCRLNEQRSRGKKMW